MVITFDEYLLIESTYRLNFKEISKSFNNTSSKTSTEVIADESKLNKIQAGLEKDLMKLGFTNTGTRSSNGLLGDIWSDDMGGGYYRILRLPEQGSLTLFDYVSE